jgi:predicted RNA binding protein YcfA (HicA-like mRNA interferase family)
MQRRHLVSFLEENGCQFLREGAKHTVFVNPILNTMSTVPRHAEINAFLARKICKDLGIGAPKGK